MEESKSKDPQKSLLKFPCTFPVKIMGLNKPELEKLVKKIFDSNVTEKNKDTIKWDDFYIQNKDRLFKQNFSIAIDEGKMEIFSIEEKKITNEEYLGSDLITAINNSEGYFFKSILLRIVYI